MNLKELDKMSKEMIEEFRKLKNLITNEHHDYETIEEKQKDIDVICDVLYKDLINDDDFADVVWRLDELELVLGIQSYITGWKPIILQHINVTLQ